MRGFSTHRRRAPESATSASTDPPTATVAAANLVTKSQIVRTTSKKSWQQQLWGHLDDVGEFHYGANWRANATSRATLVLAEPANDGDEPTPADNPPEVAAQLLAELHYGQVGQSEMLRRIALHLTVVGETYVIGIEPGPNGNRDARRRWIVASNEEFTNHGGRPKVQLPDTGESIELDPDRSTIIRLWNPHPRIAWQADSAMRSALSSLREIEALTGYINAVLNSRLAGPGVLAVPTEASMPAPQQSDSAGTAPLHPDNLPQALQEAMSTAIQEPESVSRLVPITIQIPKDAIEGIKHIPLSDELSDRAIQMRQDAIARLAGAMDIPPEIVTGLSGGNSGQSSNHWNAEQIQSDAVSMHIEPLLGCICDALTTQYLWPALRAAGHSSPEQWLIWYNASNLRQRPDRSAEAQALYDKGALSTEALLRENGFSTEDAPSEQERVRLLARDLLLADPKLVSTELAKLVGLPEIETPTPDTAIPEQAQAERADQPTGSRSGDSGDDQQRALSNTGRTSQPGTPQRSTSSATAAALPAGTGQDAALVAACEQATVRALELAGKRLITPSGRDKRAANGIRGSHAAVGYHDVPPWGLHTLVESGDYSSERLTKLLAGSGETLRATVGNQPDLEQTLSEYWRALLVGRHYHQREHLTNLLAQRGYITATGG